MAKKYEVSISAEELRKMGGECINATTISAEEAIKHFSIM